MIKLERTNGILAVLREARQSLYNYRTSWPSGVACIDNETDRRIAWLKIFICDLENRIEG